MGFREYINQLIRGWQSRESKREERQRVRESRSEGKGGRERREENNAAGLNRGAGACTLSPYSAPK